MNGALRARIDRLEQWRIGLVILVIAAFFVGAGIHVGRNQTERTLNKALAAFAELCTGQRIVTVFNDTDGGIVLYEKGCDEVLWDLSDGTSFGTVREAIAEGEVPPEVIIRDDIQ